MEKCNTLFPCTRNNSGLCLKGSNIARQLSFVSPKRTTTCPVINHFIYQPPRLEDSTMNLLTETDYETELAYVQFRIRSIAGYSHRSV